MDQPTVARAAAFTVPTIVLLLGALFAISYIITGLLGLPPSLDFPLVVRVAGAASVVVGLAFAGWIFVYRSPAAMIVSTYVTFMKLFGRAPMAEPSGRTELLVVEGPQRYVRNPLYFGVVAMTFGWAFFGSITYVLLASVLLFFWFRLILIPFEERELRVLFGDQYKEYSDGVPMLIPFAKRRKSSHGA